MRNCYVSILCCFLLCALQGNAEDQKNTAPRIKVGISTTLTGDASTYGFDIRDAIQFANEKLGKGRYELIFEDDKCNAKDAVSVAHKFIDIDKVQFVLGYGCSSAALGAAPLFEKARLPLIISAASSPKLTDAGDYIFRTTPSDYAVVHVLYDHIEKRHKKIGIISEETEFCQGVRDTFVGFNEKKSLEILTEDYLQNSTDFRTLLLKLRSANVDGLFLNPQTEAGVATMLGEVRRMQWDVPLYGAYFISSRSFLDLAKEQAEGMEGVDLPSLGEIVGNDGKALAEEFVSRYGKIRSYEAMFPTAFESFRAMDLASRSGQDPREFLYGAKIDGLLGPYHFDKNGEIVGISAVMKRIEHGKAVTIR